MALTEKVRRLVEAKSFKELFDENEDIWRGLANDARELIRPQIDDRNPTVDDIKSVLMPLIELHELYRAFMQAHPKLKEKYWLGHFTDYALHRVYTPTLNIPEEQNEQGAG
jgi:hypothetical protein